MRDLEEAADVIAELISQEADRPLTLFGHSMGAMFAHEVSRRLPAGGPGGVSALLVSGHAPPGYGKGFDVHLWDDVALVQHLLALGGTEQLVFHQAELLGHVLPIIRMDYDMLSRYQPQRGGVVTFPITAFSGSADPVASHADVDMWSLMTTGYFRHRQFPGGHFFIRDHFKELVREIESAHSRSSQDAS